MLNLSNFINEAIKVTKAEVSDYEYFCSSVFNTISCNIFLIH